MPSYSSAGLWLLQLPHRQESSLRRDKQLDPSSESGNIPDPGSFVCVGMFIAISPVAPGGEVECLQIAFLALLEDLIPAA